MSAHRRLWTASRSAALVVLLFCTPTQSNASDDEALVVFAAASLRDVLSAIQRAYVERSTDVPAQVHLAGSTALRRQLESGAPADVFVCADAVDLEALRASGAILTAHAFARNRLVVVAPRGAPRLRDLNDLAAPGIRRIAIGNPHRAPVGRYAHQTLDNTGLTTRLAARCVPCENALQIVRAVASGACDVGFAYQTDVQAEPRLHVVWTVPEALHEPITYHVAVLHRTRHADRALALARFFTGDTAGTLLRQHGFVGIQKETAGALGGSHALRAAGHTTPTWGARLQPLWLSLRIATLATLCSGAAGLALGAWLARGRPELRHDVLAALADLPLVLPPTVIGLVLLELCAARGPFGNLFGARLTFTWMAAVLASSIMAFPLMVRTSRAALESVPTRYVQAARTLGATPWSAFWSVQLPLARRGVVAGLVLCFFRALGEFGATLMVAGNIPGHTQTLPLAIYAAVFEGRPRDAVLWVVLVLLLSAGGALAAQRLARSAPS